MSNNIGKYWGNIYYIYFLYFKCILLIIRVGFWFFFALNLILQIEIRNIFLFFQSSDNLCITVLILEAQHQHLCDSESKYLFNFRPFIFSIQGSFRVDTLFVTRSFLNVETYDSVLLNSFLSNLVFSRCFFLGCFLNSTSQKPTQLNVMFWSNIIILKSPLSQNVFFFLFLRLNVWAQ